MLKTQNTKTDNSINLSSIVQKGKACFDCKNYSEAVTFFEEGAKMCDPTALNMLATCFEGGFGVQKNLDTALNLLTQAAEAKDGEAAFRLALWFSDGVHSVVNFQKAVFWCARAATYGNEEAQEYLPQLYGDDV